MISLAQKLATEQEIRRMASAVDMWRAVKVVIDDFISKSMISSISPSPTPPPPAVNGLTMTQGPDPKFAFNPDGAVAGMYPNIEPKAWEPQAKRVLAFIENLSGLDVTWDGEKRQVFLAPRAGAPAQRAGLAGKLEAEAECRRISAVKEAWCALEAIVDDFVSRATAPVGAIHLDMTKGPEPKFAFDPYESLAGMYTNIPAEAWEVHAEWAIELFKEISDLEVVWDRQARLIYLSVPRPALATPLPTPLAENPTPLAENSTMFVNGPYRGRRHDNVAPAPYRCNRDNEGNPVKDEVIGVIQQCKCGYPYNMAGCDCHVNTIPPATRAAPYDGPVSLANAIPSAAMRVTPCGGPVYWMNAIPSAEMCVSPCNGPVQWKLESDV